MPVTRWWPYRAKRFPLVQLSQLTTLGLLTTALQLALVLALRPGVLPLLLTSSWVWLRRDWPA